MNLQSLRSEVRLVTPPGSSILVVSHGESTSLELDGRDAQHFPQASDGSYLERSPADSTEAIEQLDVLRSQGAEYLLIPAESFWWLDRYADFIRSIESSGLLVQRNALSIVYALRRPRLTKPEKPARVTALLATYNEQRFIRGCLENLINQGVQVYLLDNESTDRTVTIARKFLGHGLLDIETVRRDGVFDLQNILARKEELAGTLDSDWFMHADADEVRSSPAQYLSLAQAFAAVDSLGYNAVNFQEFTFIPTAECPDHDHENYEQTMQWYYPFSPYIPHRIGAWRRKCDVKLAESGGHRAQFPEIRLCPVFFPMRHYQFLSETQAKAKYSRRYPEAALRSGLHGGTGGWRNTFPMGTRINLPPALTLRHVNDAAELDASDPRLIHWLEEQM